MHGIYGPQLQPAWGQNPWFGQLGLEQFMNPQQEILRQQELQQLSQAINRSGLKQQDVQGLITLLQAFRAMPHADLLTLLALLNPEIQRMLQEAMGQTAFNPQATGGGGGGGGGGMPRATGGGGGGGGGGTTQAGGTGSVAPQSGPAPGGTAMGQRIAQSGASVANRRGTTGWCYAGVAEAVKQATGLQLTGGSAYMAADQLARSGKFREVQVSQSELRNLPPGAIVVWGKTGASPHGHISIALGDGREASDHIQQQITSLRGANNYRVFMPNG